MEQRTTTDPDRELERAGDELEERIERLDDNIGDARQEAQARREDPTPRRTPPETGTTPTTMRAARTPRRSTTPRPTTEDED